MKAEYVDHLGDDLRVVDAARVSFDKKSRWYFNEETKLHELCIKDVRLIRYLAKHGHWTPFSQPQITLRLTVPIFVARQDFKHQIGFTRNEVSRRYVDDDPEFFVPDVWRSRPEGSVKQGSGEAHEDSEIWGVVYEALIHHTNGLYRDMIGAGIAPEQARMILPQSMYTSYYTTGSLAAWARAYSQRVDAHAQKEIQDLYTEVGKIIAPLFPVSWEALTGIKP